MDIMNPLADPSNVGGGPPAPAAGVTPTQTGQTDIVGQWNQWLTQPGNRAMLGQMGAMLLQPTAPGQTFAGKIGQAVAGGAAAKQRNQEFTIKQQQAQQAIEQQNRQTDISQQNADTSRFTAETGATFNQGYLQSLRQSGTDANAAATNAIAMAKADSEGLDPKYYGKSVTEIMAMPDWQAKFASSQAATRATATGAPSLGAAVQQPAPGPRQWKEGDVYTYPSGVRAILRNNVWVKL